jgi:hypothetical protein
MVAPGSAVLYIVEDTLLVGNELSVAKNRSRRIVWGAFKKNLKQTMSP